jgi:hypothetical protein
MDPIEVLNELERERDLLEDFLCLLEEGLLLLKAGNIEAAEPFFQRSKDLRIEINAIEAKINPILLRIEDSHLIPFMERFASVNYEIGSLTDYILKLGEQIEATI